MQQQLQPARATSRLVVTIAFATLTYVALLAGLALAALYFHVFPGAPPAPLVASFAILFAPYWAFGFGAATPLRRWLRNPAARVLAPTALLAAYLVVVLPNHAFSWHDFGVLAGVPLACALLLERGARRAGGDTRLRWEDGLALLLLALPVSFRVVDHAWPYPGMSSMPKLLFIDAALYGFLVVRGLEGVGYDFRPRWYDLAIGLREWAFFFPFAIAIGFATQFIAWHARVPGIGQFAAAWVVTFLLVAIPEELFFRGLLQNLLETRLGPRWALVISACVFGLAHFNRRGSQFNWRYVILAAVAGFFYGRAWRARRRLFASGITHTAVDVVWSLWFR